MNSIYLRIFNLIVFIGLISILHSCSDDDGQINCNPEYVVSTSININYPLYSELETRGWTYVSGEGTGTMGIVVVRQSNGSYKAFDRNAPHICPTGNSQLQVVDDIKLMCPEDGAEWILLTGEPIKIADRAPRLYRAERQGDLIVISNL